MESCPFPAPSVLALFLTPSKSVFVNWIRYNTYVIREIVSPNHLASRELSLRLT